MEYELANQGLLEGDIVNETDYLMGSTNPLEIPKNENTNNYFYNQAKLLRTRNACVLYANAAALGYLMDYCFSEDELLEIVLLAEDKYFRKESSGMQISNGVDCVRHYWNDKFPDRKVKSFRMTIGDEDFTEALRMNHRIVVGYRTSREYYKDAQTDGVIDFEEFIDYTGGHAVTSILGVAEVISTDTGILIQDNYTGVKPFNIYYNNKISKLKETGTFFPSAYIYLKEKTMEETIRENIDLELAKKAFDLGIFNGLNPRENVSRQENAVMNMRSVELVLELLNRVNNTGYTLDDLRNTK